MMVCKHYIDAIHIHVHFYNSKQTIKEEAQRVMTQSPTRKSAMDPPSEDDLTATLGTATLNTLQGSVCIKFVFISNVSRA